MAGARRSADDHLDGARVLVTGGTRNIGHAIATRFLGAGAGVVVCGRREPAEPPATGERVADFVAADLRDPEQAAATVDAAVERLGGLDVVINNAGGSPPAEAATVSPRFVERIVALNLLAPFYVAQRANAVMQEQGGGTIVNIGSVSGRIPAPGTAAYSAAKAGLSQLTRALALEWTPRVRVNQVTVGLVRTDLAEMHYGDADALDEVARTIPLGRMAEPGDVADACVLLTSPIAGYVNGAELLLDGGGELPPRSLAADPRGCRDRPPRGSDGC
jgi:NAD(P)-dependent dehydrogenase (short-subunit alcohol dehydrogenase family)